MTLNEMTQYIADALNLGSPEAKARIAREINLHYKRVTSAIGMIPTRREEVTANVTIGNKFVEFTGIEKLDVVFHSTGCKNTIMKELTHDEMLSVPRQTGAPTRYSIFSVSPTSVTIMLDCEPTVATTLYAHGLADVTTLSGEDAPQIPESFHDVIIHGVMADEYRRMEKLPFAKSSEQAYEQRLSDLKLFLAKSAYLDIYGGKLSKSDGWWDSGKRS